MKKITSLTTLPLIALLMVFTSCSQLMNERTLKYEDLPLLANEQDSFCSEEKGASLANQNREAFKIFLDFLPKVRASNALTSIDEFVLWTLFQMNLRPDATTARSRFQALITIRNETRYFDITIQDDEEKKAVPTLFALKTLLEVYGSKHSLEKLAYLHDRFLPPAIPIGPKMATILKDHQSQIMSDPYFKKIYFRVGHPLLAGETIPRLKLLPLVKNSRNMIQKNDLYRLQTHLFVDDALTPEQTPIQTSCNFDLNIYRHDIYLVTKENHEYAHPFMMTKKNGDHYLATTAQLTFDLNKNNTPFEKTTLFQGTPSPYPMAMCQLKSNVANLHLISTKGRDTAQQIFQLINNQVDQSTDLKTLSEKIAHYRFMTLYNPKRMVYETHRLDTQQTQKIRNLKLPIYHAPSIGNIWGHGKFASGESGLIVDPRNPGAISCQK